MFIQLVNTFKWIDRLNGLPNCRNASDIFQNGEVTTEEFMEAIRRTCIGKPFSELPNSFKGFIDSVFKTIDIDGTSLFMIPSLLLHSGNESQSPLYVTIDNQ